MPAGRNKITIVGAGNVNVAGADVSASVISAGGSVSGNTASATVGAFNGVAAPAAQKTTEDADQAIAGKQLTQLSDEDEKKKHAAEGPALAHSTGRVTVILPKG